MNQPGTPAITLPTFTTPAFTAATVEFGAVVTDFTLESETPRSNVPFKFAQPFKQGELAPDDLLVGRLGVLDIPLQVDAKATHADGSLRHAIISGIWPSLPAGDTVISLVREQRRPGEAAEHRAVPMSAVATIGGVEWVASPAGDGMGWLSGRFAVERIFNVPFMRDGVAHPDLTAQFCVRSYAGGALKVDVTLEHTKAYSLTGDITYDAKIIIDGTVRDEESGLVNFPYARWKRSFHIGHDPIHIKHNIDYLIGTKVTSNYDRRVKPSEKTLAGYVTEMTGPTFAPMGNGPFQKAMGTTGGRPDIGLAPDSYAMTILTMDKRAKAMMLASADAAGSWSAHRRDTSNGPAAGRPIDIIHFPYGSLIGTLGDTKNRATGQSEKMPKPVSSSTLGADTSHQPAFAYIPYLLTGDYFYLEELHFWSNYNLYSLLPAYRDFDKGLFKGGQVRAQAWTLRTLAEAAYVTPDDHPAKASFHYWMNTNAENYSSHFMAGPSSNSLGIITSGYAFAYNDGRGIAPWQDDFFTSAVGHAVELGFDNFRPLLDWKAKFPIGRMTDKGFCWINASVYELNVRDMTLVEGAKPVYSPVYPTFGQCYEATFGDMYGGFPCNSPERLAHIKKTIPDTGSLVLSQMNGYAQMTAGFPANMQPGLAYAVDSGIPGGKESWEIFDSRAMQPDYGTSPQFAIVPRTIGTPLTAELPIEPPVEVPPVVIPTPAPEPAPDPKPEPAPVEPIQPPIEVPTPTPTPPVEVPVDPPQPTEPAPAVGMLTFSSPELIGQTGITLIVGDLGTKRVFAFHPAVDANGTVTVSSSRILAGVRYGAVAASDDGKVLAVLFPVIGG